MDDQNGIPANSDPQLLLDQEENKAESRSERLPGFGASPAVPMAARGYPDFRCPSLAGSARPCVLSEVKDDQLVFFAFDPLQGKRGELARLEFGPNSGYYNTLFDTFWDLSPDWLADCIWWVRASRRPNSHCEFGQEGREPGKCERMGMIRMARFPSKNG